MTNTNTEMTGVIIIIIMISQEGKKKIQGLVKWRGKKKKKDEVDEERERTKMLIKDCRNQTMESCQ